MALPLRAIAIENYRSIRKLYLPVERLTVLVGRNGVGKSNLYRALELLQRAAAGTITRALVEEGGIESAFWAGKRRDGDLARIRLKAIFDELDYAIEIGTPAPIDEAALTPAEPMAKAEELRSLLGRKPVTLMKRGGPSAWLRDDDGARQSYSEALIPSETALAVQLAMGNSLERAAEALEICKETARTQLKSVFGKTGTHRQGELVALLGSLPAEPRPPAPLANDPADTQA